MRPELKETPSYKIGGSASIVVNGIPHPPDSIFETKGWPPNAGINIKAENLPAQRILVWLAENKFDVFRPEVPWNAEHKCFYLPGASPDPRSVVLKIVPPDRQRPGMPKYRALTRLTDDPFASLRRFPHRTIEAGEVIVVLSWPRFYENEVEPANHEAELVMRYFADGQQGNPALLPSPWDDFAEALFLPNLPAAFDWGNTLPRSPATPRWWRPRDGEIPREGSDRRRVAARQGRHRVHHGRSAGQELGASRR